MSLDVFRGATIAAMMLVNNPGNWDAVYKPLMHAEWHGWTFADLVFPFFLWIVGVAIPLSTARRLEQGQSRNQLLLHAVRRSVIIFALGFGRRRGSRLVAGSATGGVSVGCKLLLEFRRSRIIRGSGHLIV